MSGRKGMKHYPERVKREVIRLYLEEGWSRTEIMEKHHIYDKNRVRSWVIQYEKEGEKMFEKKERRGRKPRRENQEAYIKRLEMENELLKKFHTELRKNMLVRRNIG